MSFILDALKKLERQKQKDGGGTAAHETVMEGGRRWGETRRRYAGWGGVVLALVAMVVAVVALYQSRNVDAPPFTEPENVSTTPLTEAAAEGLPPSTSPPPVGPDVSDSGKGGDIDRPTAFPSREEAAPDAPEEAELEDAGTIPEEEIESIPPVRLVGSGTGDSTSPEPISEGAEVSDQIPEGLPELVLQGTSVVDGRPIAVINYQRLFEGDMIEGALVVKIADRIVELEYEGKRFVLRL